MGLCGQLGAHAAHLCWASQQPRRLCHFLWRLPKLTLYVPGHLVDWVLFQRETWNGSLIAATNNHQDPVDDPVDTYASDLLPGLAITTGQID